MPIGMITLVVVAVLIYFGVAQRVLDRMGLTDRAALLFLAAMFFGSYIPDIPLTRSLAINIGGGLVPVVLALYLLARADTGRERSRAIIATLISAAAIYGTMKILPPEPTYAQFLDPMYIFALLAGLIAYLAGRSRRSAFIAGTMGIVLTDIISRIEVGLTGGRGTTVIGGAGVFDTVVLAGIIAVGLAEIIGEGREYLQGGSAKEAGQKTEGKVNLRGVPGPALMETAEEPVPDREIGTDTKGYTGEVSRGENKE
ncbi:MAG TPA: DUF1614 domain-containing protein [Firmicutes bacterium]|nr:DUF1614 domain-containing protein [Bacillota bacterium]